jgi:serine/threonine protein kinase
MMQRTLYSFRTLLFSPMYDSSYRSTDRPIRSISMIRAVDIWSLGCVMIEMATAKPPWAEKNFTETFRTLYHIGHSNEIPKIPTTISAEAQEFTKLCLSRDPLQRPSAFELLQHRWFAVDDTASPAAAIAAAAAAAGSPIKSSPLATKRLSASVAPVSALPTLTPPPAVPSSPAASSAAAAITSVPASPLATTTPTGRAASRSITGPPPAMPSFLNKPIPFTPTMIALPPDMTPNIGPGAQLKK